MSMSTFLSEDPSVPGQFQTLARIERSKLTADTRRHYPLFKLKPSPDTKHRRTDLYQIPSKDATKQRSHVVGDVIALDLQVEE